MKIIGYGICGPGESKRYMRATLECFKGLCDEVIILCNGASRPEMDLISSFGFTYRSDRREWGKWQWKIKQDFLERDILPRVEKGDMLVCLDMDEVFDKNLTREWLQTAPFDAYHVFVVDLWEQGYKPESCFWNVRIWRWNGDTKFKQKPVHCGLAPEWTYHYHRHAPFILKHYGLVTKEDRARKIARYERYDPNAQHLDRRYYDMLHDDTFKAFYEDELHTAVAKEVEGYRQTKPRSDTIPKKVPRFAYVRNPFNQVIDIPERHVEETLKRGGFEFIGWADDAQREIESLFEDVLMDEDSIFHPETLDGSNGAYQRSTASLEKDLDKMNEKDKKLPPLMESEQVLVSSDDKIVDGQVLKIKSKSRPKKK